MLLLGYRIYLVLAELKCPDKLFTCFVREYHIINKSSFSCFVGMCKLFAVLVFELFLFFLRIICSGYLFPENNFDCTFCSHHCNLGGGPGHIIISTNVLAVHYVVGAAIGFPGNNGHFWHCCLTERIEKLSTVFNDTAPLLVGSRQEPRHIFKHNQRNVECITKANKPGSFYRCINIKNTRK